MRESTIPVTFGALGLAGDLRDLPQARSLVIFVHGNGSSRLSQRNRHVAQALQRRGFSTLLVDLLTPAESASPERGPDVARLSRRLAEVIDAMAPRGQPIGLFGANGGVPVALVAAAARPQAVQAVVARGGRPDLAGVALAGVHVPTLLLVGAADADVLALNRQALGQLGGPASLHLVPRATHLFEEAGALEEVAREAGDWFARHLAAGAG